MYVMSLRVQAIVIAELAAAKFLHSIHLLKVAPTNLAVAFSAEQIGWVIGQTLKRGWWEPFSEVPAVTF